MQTLTWETRITLTPKGEREARSLREAEAWDGEQTFDEAPAADGDLDRYPTRTQRLAQRREDDCLL